MKSESFFKNLILWLINLILYIAIFVGTILALHWLLIKPSFNGKILAEIYCDFAASFPGFHVIFHIESGLLSGIDFLLTWIFIVLGVIFVYIGIILLGLGIAVAVTEGTVIRRKNCWCKLCYRFEEILHLKHKELTRSLSRPLR